MDDRSLPAEPQKAKRLFGGCIKKGGESPALRRSIEQDREATADKPLGAILFEVP